MMAVLGLFAACSEKPSTDKQILFSVNEFQLTASEFEKLLARAIDNDPRMTLSDQTRQDYLDEMIQKQVLIQEARRQKLDQDEEFIRIIQLYWESTLIRTLIESKSREIEKQADVCRLEIEQYYNERKLSNPSLKPLNDVESNIVAEVKNQKMTAMFQIWMDDLKKQAQIRIDRSLLGDR